MNILELLMKIDKRCIFCNNENKNYLCINCKKRYFNEVKLEDVNGNLEEYKAVYIDIFTNIEDFNTKHIYVSGYYGKVSKYIDIAKFYGKPYYFKAILGYIGIIKVRKNLKYDFYTYVPSSRISIFKRGIYIPKYIAKIINGFWYETIMVNNKNKILKLNQEKNLYGIFKCVKNKEIKLLKKYKRYEVVKEKFIIDERKIDRLIKCIKKYVKKLKNSNNPISGRTFKILIVDDVYTSGATLNYLKTLLMEYLEKNFTYSSKNLKEIKKEYNIIIDIDFFTVAKD